MSAPLIGRRVIGRRLIGRRMAILAADGVERVELERPRS
jgi:hypothetical protein